MSISSSQHVVDGTPIQLVQSGGYYEATIHCASGAAYLGGAGVTSSTGFKLDNGQTITIQCPDGSGLYAIANNTTATLYALKVAL